MLSAAEQLAQEDRQLAFSLRVLNGADPEGSKAIALGRGAAIALERGDKETANRMWNEVVNASPTAQLDQVFPSIEKFVAGAKQNGVAVQSAFSAQATRSANDLPVSNAAGSYAFAVDALIRPNAAFVNGGEMEWAKDWGAKALEAAGFKGAAAELNNRLTQRAARTGVSQNK